MSLDFCSRTLLSCLLPGKAQHIHSYSRDRMQRWWSRLFVSYVSGCANLRCKNRNKERRFLDRYVFSAKGAGFTAQPGAAPQDSSAEVDLTTRVTFAHAFLII